MAADEERGEGARALDGNQWVERLDVAQTRVAEIQGELAAARDAEGRLDGQLATAHVDTERFVAEMASAQADIAQVVSELTSAQSRTAQIVASMTGRPNSSPGRDGRPRVRSSLTSGERRRPEASPPPAF